MPRPDARIFLLCPEDDTAVGGIKQIYRHADILNKNGFQAFVLHKKTGFRCSWFENTTMIAYKRRIRNLPRKRFSWIAFLAGMRRLLSAPFARAIRPFFRAARFSLCPGKQFMVLKDFEPQDYLVVPEVYGSGSALIEPGVKKVIFNQNANYTFSKYSLDKDNLTTPYLHRDVIATIVISDHSFDYLRYVFPELSIFRMHYGIDSSVFRYSSNKKKQIAFMPRKLTQDVEQVVNMLKFRGALQDFTLVPIDSMTQSEVANNLRESLIFLSFSTKEGCPLPPMEAMSCGCVVVGYHGNGGKEYFDTTFSCPVTSEDTLGFSKTVEALVAEYSTNPSRLIAMGKAASECIQKNYSMEKEAQDVVSFWSEVIE